MKRKFVFRALPVVVVAAAGLYFYGGHAVPAGQPALVHLTAQNLAEIQTPFNRAKDEVRILVLLSPT